MNTKWVQQGMFWFVGWVSGVMVAGCGSPSSTPQGPPQGTNALSVSGISGEDLFKMALDNLEHLEKYHSGEMLQQVVERFNQWIKLQPVPEGWKPDPMLARLPKRYQELPPVRELDKLEFPPEDAYVFLAGIWSRDLAKWVAGPRGDELQQAQRLFDWTVRNIQLQPSSGPGAPAWRQLPWETLLLGRGTSLDRAWVFILLTRQLGIEAFLIGLAPEESDQASGEVPWAVGVLRDKEIYVFDPALGLPIPGPEAVPWRGEGPLEIRPATLRQLAATPTLFRRLDLGEKERYPVMSGDLARAVALIPALPVELSVRMQMVESRLVGAERMSLVVRASEQAERLRTVGGLREVKLWTRPFAIVLDRLEATYQTEFLEQRALALAPFEIGNMAPLWRARVAHLRGNLAGERGATYFYHQARPPESQLNIAVAEGKIPAWARTIFLRAKADASYWLGLVCFELGQYQAAIDYFQKRTLEASPDGPWQSGAHYNLARTYEVLGQYEEAVREYEAEPKAPDSYGRRLRARWLRELALQSASQATPKTEKPSPSAPQTEKVPPSKPAQKEKPGH